MSPLPKILKGQRTWLFARLIANGLGQIGVAVSTALAAQYVFDQVMGDTTAAHHLAWIATALVALGLLLAWLRRTEYADAERMGQDYVYELRMRLFNHMQRTALRAFQGRSRGGVMLRFIGDLNAVRRWISLGLARLTVGGLTLVGAASTLTALNPRFGLASLMVLVPGAWYMARRGLDMRNAVRQVRRRRSQLATNIHEKIASLAVIQVFGRLRRERRRLAKQSRRLKETSVRQAETVGLLRGISEGATALTSATVLVVGAMEVSAGRASSGTVVAAMSIVGMLIPALRDLARVYEYRQSALIAEEKIADFLAMPSAVTDFSNAIRLKVTEGRLTLDQVTIGNILQDISAEAEPGQRVAVIGPNGAGKSTLLLAVARILDPERGSVRIDGQAIHRHTTASLRRHVSMLSPDLPLMRGTVEDNLRYRWPKAPATELDRVIELCGINETVQELPDGLHSRVREGGHNLSLGQRQRIALARAILGNPAILLLDEADENLDPQASLILDRILAHYTGTVLVVTHRRERAARADWLWHLSQGRLVETGRPQSLLNSDGPSGQLFQRAYQVAS